MLTAKSGEDGLEVFKQNPIELVIEEVCGVKVFHLDFEPSGTAASAVSETFAAAVLLNAKNAAGEGP